LFKELKANRIRLIIVRLAPENQQVMTAGAEAECSLEGRVNPGAQVAGHPKQLRLAHHIEVISKLRADIKRNRAVYLRDQPASGFEIARRFYVTR
jgi:hypothetical protein